MGNCVTTTKELKKAYKCHVITYKWKGKSDLINFTAKENKFTSSDYILTKPGYLMVNKKESSMLLWSKEYSQNDVTEQFTSLYFDINGQEGKQPLNFIHSLSQQNQLSSSSIWMLLNYDKSNNKGVQLEEGDCIMIGKQIMRIKIIKTGEKEHETGVNQNTSLIDQQQAHSLSDLNFRKSNGNQITTPTTVMDNEDFLCRVCLDTETQDNPFHKLCICHKTMPTHLSCLQKWLKKNAAVTEVNGITFYNFLDIQCEICKTPFPATIERNGKQEPILEPELPESNPYMLIEVFKIEDPSQTKAFLILDISQDRAVSVGRADDGDIIFKHNSISRNHCQLIIDKGKVLIKDCGSKFGTMKLLRDRKELVKRSHFILKINKYLIEVHPFKKKPCVCVKKKDYVDIEINPYKVHTKLNPPPIKEKSMNRSNSKRKREARKEAIQACSLEQIPEIDAQFEESLKHNNLVNELGKHDEPVFNFSQSLEQELEGELDPLGQSGNSFRQTLKQNQAPGPSNFKNDEYGTRLSFNDSFGSVDSLKNSQLSNDYAFN